jgi:hypothetical protein
MKDRAAAPAPKLRWNDVFKDVSSSVNDGDDESREWPDPDYFTAALRCKDDRTNMEKLYRICEDLESQVCLAPGPGSFVRLAGVPTHALRALEGRCWREVLTEPSYSRLVWVGVGNYGEALQGKGMDSGTVRFGKIVWTVAMIRLQRLGEPFKSEQRRHQQSEKEKMLQKPYLPRFIGNALG